MFDWMKTIAGPKAGDSLMEPDETTVSASYDPTWLAQAFQHAQRVQLLQSLIPPVEPEIGPPPAYPQLQAPEPIPKGKQRAAAILDALTMLSAVRDNARARQRGGRPVPLPEPYASTALQERKRAEQERFEQDQRELAKRYSEEMKEYQSRLDRRAKIRQEHTGKLLEFARPREKTPLEQRFEALIALGGGKLDPQEGKQLLGIRPQDPGMQPGERVMGDLLAKMGFAASLKNLPEELQPIGRKLLGIDEEDSGKSTAQLRDEFVIQMAAAFIGNMAKRGEDYMLDAGKVAELIDRFREMALDVYPDKKPQVSGAAEPSGETKSTAERTYFQKLIDQEYALTGEISEEMRARARELGLTIPGEQ